MQGAPKVNIVFPLNNKTLQCVATDVVPETVTQPITMSKPG